MSFARLSFAALLSVSIFTASAHAERPVNPFDGKSLDGWMTVKGDPAPAGWEVVDGVIHLKPGKQGGGNIVTRHQYGDFSLSFEWKVAAKGNSGIKYRVRDYKGKTLGIEYQIYDDNATAKPGPARGSAGSIYDLYEPNAAKMLKPVGEYNTARIVVRNNHIQHWLNGKLIANAYVGGAEWNKRIAESKFNDIPGFGENEVGRLMLTDHGTEVWIRNARFQTYHNDGGESRRRRFRFFQR